MPSHTNSLFIKADIEKRQCVKTFQGHYIVIGLYILAEDMCVSDYDCSSRSFPPIYTQSISSGGSFMTSWRILLKLIVHGYTLCKALQHIFIHSCPMPAHQSTYPTHR